MIYFLLWYVTLSLLGLLTFPLAYHLLPALADRGYALARTLGLLLWGYVFWLLASLGILQNDAGGILFGLAVLIGLSAWALLRTTDDRSSAVVAGPSSMFRGLSSIVEWLKSNSRVVITTEILFLAAFAFMAVIRAANPEITTAGGEKTMEAAFINAIMRSPTFPPHDPWLSGYAISYYYFGYVMTAMLAEFTGVPGPVAHNLMLSLIFALTAAGAYGLVYNLLAAIRKNDDGQRAVDDEQDLTVRGPSPAPSVGVGSVVAALLGPLFLLFVSNVEGFLELLHRHGLFWNFAADGTGTSSFWSWLDMKELSQAPTLPLGWIPDRFYWWWRASRVIQDYDLNGNWREIIDEFPMFSYVLGDLHPHVLAMPFGMLSLGVALNLYLGGFKGETNLFGLRLPIRREGIALAALVLGGLAFLNTWDFPIHMAILAGAFVLMLARERGWGWGLIEEFFKLVIPLGVAGVLLYLPFYLGFSSQAGGIVPNLVWPTRGAHLWVMFGPLLVPLLAYLIYLWRGARAGVNWIWGAAIALVIVLALWAFSWAQAWFVITGLPDLANDFLNTQGVADTAALFAQAGQKRFENGAGLLTLFLVLAGTLAFFRGGKAADADAEEAVEKFPASSAHPDTAFVLLLMLFGGLLVLAPEFIYLRDQFGWRMNTVFKFYYQAWQLWSLAAAFAVALMFANLRGLWRALFAALIAVVLVVGLAFPVLAIPNKANNLMPQVWTLDGSDQLRLYFPDDAAAIDWLKTAPPGVVAEAVGGSYTDFARVATYSGLPDVLGWPGHESQWRGGYVEMGTREDDIKQLYTSSDWSTALGIIQRYDIHYVYIGGLERSTYAVDETKFGQHMLQAYSQGSVVIYTMP